MADTNKAKLNNLLFYGVSYGEYDTQDVNTDIITNIRKRFLVSQKPASNKLYRSAEGVNYVYSYNFNLNRPLQWKVLKNRRVCEEIVQLLSGKYCINYYDNAGKDLKKVFFDSKHRWFKTNYYNSVSNENLICSLVPKEFDTGTCVLKYMTGSVYPERLYACSIPSCDEVRAAVLAKIKAPDLVAMTNVGIVYFMTEEDMLTYEKILFDEESRYEAERAPKVFITDEDSQNGFNLTSSLFDMSVNSDRKFDISLAEQFEEIEVETDKREAEPQLEDAVEVAPEISVDDGTIFGAIADTVNQINSKTSLEINTDDILNFRMTDVEEEKDNGLTLDTEIFDLSDSDPAIDKKLRHIDSVLDDKAVLTAERQLVIGETVVDDDYISSIIDGIISSAFRVDDSDSLEVAESVTENVEETLEETSEETTEVTTEVTADEVNETSENISFFADDAIDFDDIPVHDPEPLMVIDVPDAAKETEVSEDVDDASVSEENTEEIDTIDDTAEDAVSYDEVVVEDNTPEVIDENVDTEIGEEDVFVVAPAKNYISDNTPDSVISSRGESYYYYGDVDENGRRSGRGRTLMSDGNIAYEGGYADDKRSGSGSFYFKDGSLCYWGNWQDNVRSGFGVGVSSDDKAVHCGNWQDNKPLGVGARFDSEGKLVFLSTDCADKKAGFTISEFSDKSFTVCVWSEEDSAFVKRKITIDDILK